MAATSSRINIVVGTAEVGWTPCRPHSAWLRCRNQCCCLCTHQGGLERFARPVMMLPGESRAGFPGRFKSGLKERERGTGFTFTVMRWWGWGTGFHLGCCLGFGWNFPPDPQEESPGLSYHPASDWGVGRLGSCPQSNIRLSLHVYF